MALYQQKCSWIICQLICKILQHYNDKLESYEILNSTHGSKFACEHGRLPVTFVIVYLPVLYYEYYFIHS